jgi:hypothetical protein
MINNVDVHPFPFNIESDIFSRRFQKFQLRALIKTNRLMPYREVSTFVILYEMDVLHSVRTKRRIYRLWFNIPVAFSVAHKFFSVSDTPHIKQDATCSIFSVLLKKDGIPTHVAVFRIFLMFLVKAWCWLHPLKHVTCLFCKKKIVFIHVHSVGKTTVSLAIVCVSVCVRARALLWTSRLPIGRIFVNLYITNFC